jgi:hypothetical protein
MKRYLAFVGYAYYPNGGMDDFLGDFDTAEEAIKAINTTIRVLKALRKNGPIGGRMCMIRNDAQRFGRGDC